MIARALHWILPALLAGLFQPGYGQSVKASFVNPFHYYEKGAPAPDRVEMIAADTAWRGERWSTAFCLWTEGTSTEELRFRITDPAGNRANVSSSSVRLRSVSYVKADPESKPCGGYAHRDPEEFTELGDILCDRVVTTLDPGYPSLYWFTIDLPATASPGPSEWTIQVLHGEQLLLELSIRLFICELRLPPPSDWTFHLDLWQYPSRVLERYNEAHPGQEIETWSPEHFRLLGRLYEHLARMGQKVITAHIKEGALGSPSMIRWTLDEKGSWEFNFDAFDRYVELLWDLGIQKQISCHSPVGWNSGEIRFLNKREGRIDTMEAPIGSERYQVIWDQFLTAFRTHLTERGWFDITVLYLDEVEPEKLDWILHFLHSNNPDWKIGLAAFHTPTDNVLSHLYDLSLMIGTEIPAGFKPGTGQMTFYTSCNPVRPNSFITCDADPWENLWIGWYACLKGMNGFLRWAWDNWTLRDPANQQAGTHTSGDFAFIYRSSNDLNMQFYSSVRLELIREGIEDYEKISILKNRLNKAGSEEAKLQFADLLETLDQFDPATWDPAELPMRLRGARALLNEIASSLK